MPRETVLNDATTHLLIHMLPMIKRHTSGDKQKFLSSLWLDATRGVAARAIGTDVSGLPKDRTMAALACVDAALALAQRVGITRADLAEHFNVIGERAQQVPPPELESIEQLLGFVLAFAMQHEVDQAAATAEARSA